MDYQKQHDLIIEQAQARPPLDGYVERHHIIPKSMGGSNDPSNIAILTAREHYIIHQLLVKIHPGDRNMIFAARMMTIDKTGGRVNNRLYEWLKIKYSKANSENKKGNIPWNKGLTGTFTHTPETRKIISESSLGRIPWNKGKKCPPSWNKGLTSARSIARKQEKKQYTSDKACKHGHMSPRWVYTGNCIECMKIRISA